MIIIKGKSRAGAGSLAKHLLNEHKNETVRVTEVRGTLSDDLHGAFNEMEDVASGTRCTKALYHAQINPDPDNPFTPDQWARSIEALEENLGLSADHPRAVVFHVKDGREHAHVVWGRVNPDTMETWSDSWNYIRHEETSRALEQEFDRQIGRGAFTRGDDDVRPERTPEHWEMQQGERLGLDARDMRDELQAIRARCDNGGSFAVALEEEGYSLAMGDRLCVIDPEGGVHSLSRMLGMKAAAVRDYFTEFDLDALPGVEAVREKQREAQVTAELDVQPGPSPARTDPMGELADVQVLCDVYTWFRDPAEFVEAVERRDFLLARVTPEEAAVSRYDAEVAASHGNYQPTYAEGDLLAVHARGTVYRFDGALLNDVQAHERLAQIDQAPLLSLGQAQEVAAHFREPWDAERHDAAVALQLDPQGSNPLGVAARVVDEGIGVVEQAASWIERFLFGGPAPARTAEGGTEALASRKNEAEATREHIARQEKSIIVDDPDVKRRYFGVDPEVLEEMRRIREQREREQDDRDRGIERDR